VKPATKKQNNASSFGFKHTVGYLLKNYLKALLSKCALMTFILLHTVGTVLLVSDIFTEKMAEFRFQNCNERNKKLGRHRNNFKFKYYFLLLLDTFLDFVNGRMKLLIC